jgi:hypothetical protein
MTINRVDEDLKNLNFQFLMLLRECARHYPLEAKWKFSISESDIEKVSLLTLNEVNVWSACSRPLFTVIPNDMTSAHVSSSILAALQPVKANFQMADL